MTQWVCGTGGEDNISILLQSFILFKIVSYYLKVDCGKLRFKYKPWINH